MDESQIVDIWTLFKEYLDKKNQDIAAERFVDMLADYGVDDHTLTQVLGSDSTLDGAINYFLDIDEENYEDDDPWEDED
jgi:hypothetical protein